MLGSKKVRDLTALGRDGFGADSGRIALRDTVEDVSELVAGVLADFLRAVRVVVVECLCSTQSLNEWGVTRAASRDYLATRQNSKLDRQTARRSATTVDQNGVVRLLTARKRQAQALI